LANQRPGVTPSGRTPPISTIGATNAQGQAIIKHRTGGDLSFKVLVAGVQNVVAAHIHCAPLGALGQLE
jgi:hypothetical protein